MIFPQPPEPTWLYESVAWILRASPDTVKAWVHFLKSDEVRLVGGGVAATAWVGRKVRGWWRQRRFRRMSVTQDQSRRARRQHDDQMNLPL